MLQSTFKTGKIVKNAKRGFEINVSLFLMHRLHQIANLIKARRQFRPPEYSDEIYRSINQEIKGFRAQSVKFIEYSEEGAPVKENIIENTCARLSFQDHSNGSLLIESLDLERIGDESHYAPNFENLTAGRFLESMDLQDISMIATDMRQFWMQGSKAKLDPRHEVRIYGRCI